MRQPFLRHCAFGVLSLSAALLAEATPAMAQSLPGLSVHRTDDTRDCPDARALAGIVARHMKRPALEPVDELHAPARAASLDVQIYRSEEGYTAVVHAGLRTRQLADKGATCAGLTGALSIMLAILLDTEIPPPPPPPPLPPALPAPAPPLVEPPQPPPALLLPEPPSPRRSWGLAAGLTIGGAAGVLQRLAIAGAGEVELRLGRSLSLEGGVIAFASQTSPYMRFVKGAEIGKPEFETWLTAGNLRGCLVVPLLAVQSISARAGGCLGVIAGAIHGEGHNLPVTRAVNDPWAAVEGSAIFEQRVFWRASLVSRAAVLVPFVKRSFIIDTNPAFTPAPLGVSLSLGIRLSIR